MKGHFFEIVLVNLSRRLESDIKVISYETPYKLFIKPLSSHLI